MSSRSAQRIVICLHDFSPGGTERVAIELGRAWIDAGRDVVILCGSADGPQRASVDGRIRVVQLDPPITRNPLSRFKLARGMGRVIATLSPDLVFLPGNYHLFLANGLRKANPRPAIVLKISNPPFPANLSGPVPRAIFRHFMRGVDALAPMNDGIGAGLRRMMPGRYIATRHDPIHIDVGAVGSPPPRDAAAPLRILWVGRLEPQKDVPLALATMQVLLRSAPAHLTLLGNGAQYLSTRRRIESLGLEDQVTLAGHVGRVEPYMAQADALLITSRYEGGPAVAAEALALGLPVVSTDCSSFLHDVLTLPQAGVIVGSRDPKDLARALLATIRRGRPDPSELAMLVAHLEPVACARAYLDWFDEIVRHRAI